LKNIQYSIYNVSTIQSINPLTIQSVI